MPLFPLALVLVAMPFIVGVVQVLLWPPQGVPGGDLALLELATREATEGRRLLGPYSRFEWNHPGPLLFYAMAGPYRLLDGVGGLQLAALALNGLAAGAIVAVAGRRGGSRAAMGAACVVLGLVVAMGAGRVRDPWNPYVIVLPTLLTATLCAASVTGTIRALLAAAVVGSFAAQTHVATAPFVAVLVAVAVAARWWHLRGRPGSHWAPRRTDFVLLAMLVAVWTPPLVEQFTAIDGNLSHMLRFMREREGSQSLAQGVAAAAAGAAWLPLGAPARTLPDLPSLPAGAILAAVGAVGALILRRGSGWPRVLAGTGLRASLVAALLATRVVGPLLGYLVAWMVTGPALVWIAAAAVVARRLVVPAAVAAMALTAVAVIGAAGWRDTAWHASSASAGRIAVAAAQERGAESVVLSIADSDRWATAAGVAVALERDGIDVRVLPAYVAMYGEQRRVRGDEDLAFVVASPDSAPPPGTTPLAAAPYTQLYLTAPGLPQ